MEERAILRTPPERPGLLAYEIPSTDVTPPPQLAAVDDQEKHDRKREGPRTEIGMDVQARED